MGATTVRVVKLGGSLLDWPLWVERFRSWLAAQPPARTVLIAGGGAAADEVRRRDRDDKLDPSTAHWLAIDAMHANTIVVRRLLPEAIAIDRWADLQSPPNAASLVAFSPRDFLRSVEPRAAGAILPHSWDATSDSIAARLATVLGAEGPKEAAELVLLKSASPPLGANTLERLAAAGFVDRCFPQFAGTLGAVRFVNLRDHGLPTKKAQGSGFPGLE